MASPKRVPHRQPAAPATGGTAAFLGSPTGMFVIAGVAVVVVAALVMLNGGVPLPTAVPPTIAAPPTVDPLAPTPDAASDAAADDTAANPVTPDEVLTCAGRPCPTIGPAEAPLTIIEITDYGCEHCLTLHEETMPVIRREYVDTGRARLVSHVFGFNPPTQLVAAAAWCAADVGRYFEFQSAAFESGVAAQGNEMQEAIYAAGRTAIPDADQYAAFESCVKGGTHIAEVQLASQEANDAGLRYTPSVLIGDLLIEGAEPTDVFREKIEQALAGKG